MSDKLRTVIYYFVVISLCILLITFIGMEIYVWISYGGKPINEIPTWALWFMFSW